MGKVKECVLYYMDDDSIDAYNVSQATYGSDAHHAKLLSRGYTRDDEISDDRHKVYSKNGKVVLGYRGTKTYDARDLKADLALGVHQHENDQSFKDAENVYQRTRKKYIGDELLTAGHSLGGSKSIHVAKKYGVHKSYAFNPGTGILGTNGNDTVVYNIKGDPVSSRIRSQHVRFIKQNQGGITGAHNLDNYESTFNRANSRK